MYWLVCTAFVLFFLVCSWARAFLGYADPYFALMLPVAVAASISAVYDSTHSKIGLDEAHSDLGRNWLSAFAVSLSLLFASVTWSMALAVHGYSTNLGLGAFALFMPMALIAAVHVDFASACEFSSQFPALFAVTVTSRLLALLYAYEMAITDTAVPPLMLATFLVCGPFDALLISTRVKSWALSSYWHFYRASWVGCRCAGYFCTTNECIPLLPAAEKYN